MAGKVVNLSFVLLSKFGASRQESALKTATSHIRNPLAVMPYRTKNDDKDNYIRLRRHHFSNEINGC